MVLLGGLGAVGWVWCAGVGLGVVEAPPWGVTLYTLFVSAATAGWVAGNITGWLRRRGWGWLRAIRWCALVPTGWLGLLAYAVPVGPGESGVYLPWLAEAIFAMLFLVPLTLRPAAVRSPRG